MMFLSIAVGMRRRQIPFWQLAAQLISAFVHLGFKFVLIFIFNCNLFLPHNNFLIQKFSHILIDYSILSASL